MKESTPHILMCPPDYFGVEYEINPWMDVEQPIDHAVAVDQWQSLRQILEAAGAKISLLPPVKGLPDMVFTANAALIYRDHAVISRFRHPQRQGEEPYAEAWFGVHGFQTDFPPEGVHFEGCGDALFCGDTLFAGYRLRSDAGGEQKIGEQLKTRVVPLELVSKWFYHLDTCFCPLTPTSALYYPEAFDDYGRRVLESMVEDLIPVEKQEAERFACNAVVVGQNVVTNSGCSNTHAQLRERGFTPYETPLDEFLKSGGSAKCLTLRLDGEDAALWRQTAS